MADESLDDVVVDSRDFAVDSRDFAEFEPTSTRDDPRAAIERIEAAAGWATLPPEVRALRDDIREALERLWLPSAAERFLAADFAVDVFPELGRIGAFGTSLVGRDGRGPLGRTATCAVMHALERIDGGLRCAATIQDCVIQALERYGDDEQRGRWLQPLVRGERVAAFALTESEAGSDVRRLTTVAKRRGNDWVLSGEKRWVTNGPAADLLLVWARTSERHDAIRGFLVERNTSGLQVAPIADAAAMRTAPVGSVVLDGVRLPAEAVLPHAFGLADINACLDYNRLTVAFGVMGAARACLEAAIAHACNRRQFGAPLAAKQLIGAQLADMAGLVVVGEVLALHVARRWESAPLSPFEISLSKRHNCAVALDVARRTRALLGAEGLRLGRHVIRHLLNLEASYTYGGTNEIHGLMIAKVLTGISAF